MAHSTQRISLSTAVIICINAMIGSGIFTAPMALASSAGPAGILTYIIVVIGIWCMALSFAQLAQLYPQDGSFYTYTKPWLGNSAGLAVGYLYILGLVVSTGLLTHVALLYLPLELVVWSPKLVGISIIAALLSTYVFGIQIAGIGQHILAICTLFPIIATIVLCFVHADIDNIIPFAPNGISSIFSAMRIVVFGFFGFEFSTSLYKIIENPTKNVPRTLSYSILIVGSLYTLFVAAIMLAMPMHHFQTHYMPLSAIIAKLFPDKLWLAYAIHVSIISAVLGTIHAILWTAGTLLQTLVKHTQLFTHNCAIHLLNNSFAWTACVALATIAIFVSVSNINLFFNLAALTMVSSYLFALLSLFFIHNKQTALQKLVNIIAIITAVTIIYFALQDILNS